MADKNYKLIIAYDGSRYNGWQRQGNTKNTIQEKIETVLTRMLSGTPVELQGSGRTDAGAHARAQVANFHTPKKLNLLETKQYLNSYLPEDIRILSVEQADDRFHARLLAAKKHYRYTIDLGQPGDLFERKYSWQLFCEDSALFHVSDEALKPQFADVSLDVDAMEDAAQQFLGTHDFLGFSSNKRMKKSTERTIYDIQLSQKDNLLYLDFYGDGFLYNMVRIMTGTLVEIGLGKRSQEDIFQTFLSKDRKMAGTTAPAKGLCLMSVSYEAN